MNHPQQAWPFNPKFPQAFSFPAFGTVEWWAFARWRTYGGKAVAVPAAENSKVVEKQDWQHAWQAILADNSDVARAVPFSFSDGNYAMKHPGGWVETLLDAQRFWLVEINGWALRMVEDEFKKTTPPDRFDLWHYGEIPEGEEQCKCFCRRFHAYQQARYRYYEHLLEKNCERALGGASSNNPMVATAARACLIAWLSKQEGYECHPLVQQFCCSHWGKSTAEVRVFDAERKNSSAREYRITLKSPHRPDAMAWIILAWPIWNFYKWKWVDVAQAMVEKFESVDSKGKPLDYWPVTIESLKKALRDNLDQDGGMPVERALSLSASCFNNPTPDELSFQQERKRIVWSKRDDKNYEHLYRSVIGAQLLNQTLPRKAGRATKKLPELWRFAMQIPP